MENKLSSIRQIFCGEPEQHNDIQHIIFKDLMQGGMEKAYISLQVHTLPEKVH